jgi:hemerythrin
MTITYMNSKDLCILCLDKKLDVKLIKHHVSYYPEVIAYVHYECHRKIHETPLTTFIQYKREDSIRYYKENKQDNSGTSIKIRLETNNV